MEKDYYSIGETAEILNVNASALRFWEKSFDIIKPFKNKKGDRFYSVKDLDNLKLIKHLLKERKLTIDGAKSIIKTKIKDLEVSVEIINKLNYIKDELIRIKNEIEPINNHKDENNRTD